MKTAKCKICYVFSKVTQLWYTILHLLTLMVFSIFKNGKDFVTQKQETIISAVLIMMIATFATKILGYVKIILLANIFGATRSLDIFYAANTIPEIVFNMLVIGSLNTALIPVLSECLNKKDKPEMVKVFNAILSISCIALSVVSLIGIIFAPQVAYLLIHLNLTSPDHPFTPPEIANMVNMIRVLFISPVILGVSFLISGVLIVYKRFLITQLASVLYTLGFIISIFLFVPSFGVIGLCWGVVLGSIMHLVVQLPVLRFLDVKISFQWDTNDNFVRKIGRLMGPRLIGLSGEQLSSFVDTVLALGLVSGSLSAFRFAYTYYIFPVSLIGWSYAQAVFPTLAEEYNKGRIESFKQNLIKTLQQTLYFVLPMFVLFVILRVPFVRLLGIGKATQFGWQGTQVTAWILLFFGFDIIFQSLLSIIIRAFYALHDTKTPLKASLIELILNIILSIYFVGVFGRFNPQKGILTNLFHFSYYFTGKGGSWMAVGGLAAAGTISSLVSLAILFHVLNKKLHGFDKTILWNPLAKKLIATGVMACVLYGVYKLLNQLMNTSKTLELFFLLILACYLGISIYVAMTFLLQDDEIELVKRIFQRIQRALVMKKDLPEGITVTSMVINDTEYS